MVLSKVLEVTSDCSKNGMVQYIQDPISAQKPVYVDTIVAFLVTLKYNIKNSEIPIKTVNHILKGKRESGAPFLSIFPFILRYSPYSQENWSLFSEIDILQYKSTCIASPSIIVQSNFWKNTHFGQFEFQGNL